MERRDFMKRMAAALSSAPSAANALSRSFLSAAGQTRGNPPYSPAATSKVPASSPDYEALLAQHDLGYLSPATRAVEGLPVGNGDTTAMVWMPPHGMTLTINKTNLWDDLNDLPANWIWSPALEETNTALVSGATLTFRNGTPLLDGIYMQDFHARVDLYRAQVLVDSKSPLGSVKAAAWGCSESGVLVVDYDESTPQPLGREIELSRWGSRRFTHWYRQYDPAATDTGLEGTKAGADRDHIWIEQQLREVSFAVVARFVGAPFKTSVRNNHLAVMTMEQAPGIRGQVYLAIVTSEEDPAPLAAARRKVDEAVSQGYDKLRLRHSRRWSEFWEQSYIQIPEEYLENLYYLTLYYLAVSSQGPYPPLFCGGMWTSNRDIRRWGHYYHWNEQQQYWPVHAANHTDLAVPYYRYRSQMLKQAETDAREVHKKGGAWYADVANRRGKQDRHSVIYNLTPGTQIAMDFWRHYLYTLDREFLETQAYPVMKSCATFYMDYLEKDASGIYHVPKSSGYESDIYQKDCITDLSSIRQSFPACIRASEILGVDAEMRKAWQEVIDHLVEFSTYGPGPDPLRPRSVPKVFSSGISLVDYTIPDPQGGTKDVLIKKGQQLYGISFECELAPVFPSGVIGLAQRGTETFNLAVNTVLAVEPQGGFMFFLSPAIQAARLGLGDHALKVITYIVEGAQAMPQGFFVEAERDLHTPDYSSDRWAVNTPFVIRNGQRTKEKGLLINEWFDVPTLDGAAQIMTTLTEMLLQSHDGIIRVFPALPEAWQDASFKLRTVGAFMVTATRKAGEVQPLSVQSLKGGTCRLQNPWPQEQVSVRELASRRLVPVNAHAEIAEFESEAGLVYLVFHNGQAETEPDAPQPRHEVNQGPKKWNGSHIGMERYF
jgi:alpha-L-fucosidase 2